MMKDRLVIASSLCLIIILLATIGLARHTQNEQRLIGRVIARDAYLGLARLSSPESVEVFIVRVNEVEQDGRSPRFIKVRYEDFDAKEPFPSGLLDGKNLWMFSLRRDKGCDQVVSKGLFVANNNSATLPEAGSYILIKDPGPDLPKIKSLLPCFIVQPGGIKSLSSVPPKSAARK